MPVPTSRYRSASRTRRSRRPLLGTILAVALLSQAAVMTAPVTAAVSGDEEFKLAGTLSRLPDDARRLFGDAFLQPGFAAPIGSFEHTTAPFVGIIGTLVSIPEIREIWQLFPYFGPNGYRTAVAVRSMDTLEITSSFSVNALFKRSAASANGGEWMTASDPGKRIFFVDADSNGIIEIDLATHKERRFTTDAKVPLGGIGFDRFGNDVLLATAVFGSATVVNAYTLLYRLDLDTSQLSAPRPLRSCNAPLPSTETNETYQLAPYVPNKDFVYMPCQRAGYSGAVVRVPRNDVVNPSSAEDIAVGPTNLETVLVDHASGRLFLTTRRGEVWAFDTATMSFVGVVSAHSNLQTPHVGYGLDPTSGRLFFQSPSFGLGLVEGRFFPIPQAKTDAAFAELGQEQIISDDQTNKILVIPGYSENRAMEYRIYRVKPAPVPPPPPDPDGNTSDQPEKEGVAEARYNGTAGGYGARVLLANGVATIVPAPAVGDIAPTADALSNNLNVKCGFSDRELVAGRVTRAEVDTGSTVAEAIAVDLDSRTKLDLDKPSRCEPYGKNGGTDYFEAAFATAPEPLDNEAADARWHREPAACSTSEGDNRVTAPGNDHGSVPLGKSTVECPRPGAGDLFASAHAQLTGPVAVGEAYAKTVISREAGAIRATSTSVANDIRLGEGIQIDEVRSHAVSSATGRPRKADMSSHVISIKGLHISGVEVCAVCDVNTAVDALNRALAGRAQFRTGSGAADPGLVKGSPRGALSAVQKSPERQVSDRSLVGDFTSEIPALEMIVFNDNAKWGRARQLYQFAGVATSATYNIVAVPKYLDGGPNLPEELDELDSLLEEGVLEEGTTEPLEDVQSIGNEGDGGGGGILDAIRGGLAAIARGVRLFLTSPRHAMLLLTGWSLFVLPVVLYRRRLTLATL